MDDDEDRETASGNGVDGETRGEPEYAFEGYRIAFNRRIVLTPPAAAAPASRLGLGLGDG